MADPQIIVDAHEDIAENTTMFGRDFTHSAYQKRREEVNSPYGADLEIATTGLPDALLGRVGVIFGTIFTAPASASAVMGIPLTHTYDSPAAARKQGQDQLDVYHRLADTNDRIQLVRTQSDLAQVLATWQEGVEFDKHKVGIFISMEGADPIIEPKAFEEWYEQGVRAVGLAWSETRYSGGTRSPGPLKGVGRELLEVMESFNALLDVSHMSEESFYEALDRYGGHVIASHSNPRRFCNTDRHLSDDMIRRLAEHDGVMGIVPFNAFLQTGWKTADGKASITLATVVAAIDYVCQTTGSARHVGIGSDFDGGFGAPQIPLEMDTVSDLRLIGPKLAEKGYSPEDVNAILSGNFLRVLRAVLPA